MLCLLAYPNPPSHFPHSTQRPAAVSPSLIPFSPLARRCRSPAVAAPRPSSDWLAARQGEVARSGAGRWLSWWGRESTAAATAGTTSASTTTSSPKLFRGGMAAPFCSLMP